jgi:hypothetical protein
MAYPKDGNRRYLIPSQEGETRIEADCEYGAWLECAVLTLRSPSPPPTPSVRTPRAKALAHRSGTRPSRPHRTSSAQHGNKPHKPQTSGSSLCEKVACFAELLIFSPKEVS